VNGELKSKDPGLQDKVFFSRRYMSKDGPYEFSLPTAGAVFRVLITVHHLIVAAFNHEPTQRLPDLFVSW
jgi:hypothetical protein